MRKKFCTFGFIDSFNHLNVFMFVLIISHTLFEFFLKLIRKIQFYAMFIVQGFEKISEMFRKVYIPNTSIQHYPRNIVAENSRALLNLYMRLVL